MEEKADPDNTINTEVAINRIMTDSEKTVMQKIVSIIINFATNMCYTVNMSSREAGITLTEASRKHATKLGISTIFNAMYHDLHKGENYIILQDIKDVATKDPTCVILIVDEACTLLVNSLNSEQIGKLNTMTDKKNIAILLVQNIQSIIPFLAESCRPCDGCHREYDPEEDLFETDTSNDTEKSKDDWKKFITYLKELNFDDDDTSSGKEK